MTTDTITEIFERDPLHHTDADLDKIIERYRQQRTQFLLTGKKAPTKKDKSDLEDLNI